MGDHEISENTSENECIDICHDHDLREIKDNENHIDMAESRLKPETDDNGQILDSRTATKLKLDPKDPLRPRRKKARRACFACQRAHLTCGDERPCQRCIKRGLADACQDGVRKKAKYLHDAPPEALGPVLGPSYKPNYSEVSHSRPTNGASVTRSSSDTSPSIGSFFPTEATAPSYPIFTQQTPMQSNIPARISYSSQNSSMSPPFGRQGSIQCVSMPQMSNENRGPFNGALFDSSNPTLLNFDLEGINFGNNYGALEFGTLGNMTSGVAETPSKDQSELASSLALGELNFNVGIYGKHISHHSQMSPNNIVNFGGPPENHRISEFQRLPQAYAITAEPHSQHSHSTEASPTASGVCKNSPTTAICTPNSTPHVPIPRTLKVPKSYPTDNSSKSKSVSILGKRSRDHSSIYETVSEPYSYVTGFHNLIAFLQRRFSATAILRIAKSLASIRPTFISCTKTLNRQDLIFMETCFQRTLFEYEEFMFNCCTPTIICRRTGEIAAVNQEFTMMTGWRKEVLLGKEANLNMNIGKLAMDAVSCSDRSSSLTPRVNPLSPGEHSGKEAKPQPVFFAELLDDDSVVEFYEDFARLAFNESRGSVTTRCKLFKYRPREKEGASQNQSPRSQTKEVRVDDDNGDGNRENNCSTISDSISRLGNRNQEIDDGHGFRRHEPDGKLDCSYCWMIKRDVFDIPMLIVMNVSRSLSISPAERMDEGVDE